MAEPEKPLVLTQKLKDWFLWTLKGKHLSLLELTSLKQNYAKQKRRHARKKAKQNHPKQNTRTRTHTREQNESKF